MSDQQDHMDFEVNTHVEVSVTPFPCKGRLPKKNPEKVKMKMAKMENMAEKDKM